MNGFLPGGGFGISSPGFPGTTFTNVASPAPGTTQTQQSTFERIISNALGLAYSAYVIHNSPAGSVVYTGPTAGAPQAGSQQGSVGAPGMGFFDSMTQQQKQYLVIGAIAFGALLVVMSARR